MARSNVPKTTENKHVLRMKELMQKVFETRNLVLENNYIVTSMEGLQEMKTADMVDIGFLSRELEDLFDSLRKECKARKELFGKIIAVKQTQLVTQDPTLDLNVMGSLAQAKPQSRQIPIVPKAGTQEYIDMMEYFGVKKEFVDVGILEPHYMHMSDYFSKLASEGGRAPKGLLKLVPNPTCDFVARR